jgi:hypothetical protein
LIDAWWRAANYLSVGQIYLLGNPLLAEPLRPEHIKSRLLGHWVPRPARAAAGTNGPSTTGNGDREIGLPDAPVRSLVISAREDIEIARQVRATLQS